MCKNNLLIGFFFLFLAFFNLQGQNIIPGAYYTDLYLPVLNDQKVAVVTNHTGIIREKHLVDSMLSLGVDVRMVFSPEHGFRGNADAGEHVKDYTDKATNLPVYSLYGKNKKPDSDLLKKVDVVLFDLQDVGVRFYTYISTLHYVMEACAELDIPLIVLDRPNPNGFYVDGPVLQESYKSFVGLHTIPVVYGLTIGELGTMINGENWIAKECDLHVVKCTGYTHDSRYKLPVAPSPNLPNMESVYLYPSLGLFEGTIMSVGRGTDCPFQLFGHPEFTGGDTVFTPQPAYGAKYPKLKGKICNGKSLRNNIAADGTKKQIELTFLIDAYKNTGERPFFNSFFKLLTGNDQLANQIMIGKSEKEIRAGWKADIDKYIELREKYLLYPDFK